MINDDKTVVGDSSFGNSNNESSSNGNVKNSFSNANSSNSNSKNTTNQEANTKKSDNNVTKRTAAAVGVAAAVGGVAVGTVYSDEIKDTLNGLTGNDNVEEVAVVADEDISQVDNPTPSETVHHYVHHIDETSDDVIAESPVHEDETSFEFTDETGVHGVNFVDFDDDGIADSIELVENGEIVDEYAAEDFQAFLTSEDVLEQEVFSNADDLLDNELAVGNIDPIIESTEDLVDNVDFDNFDESSISLSESGISNDSDFMYEEQSIDYSDESSIGSEDYMLDTANESDSYLSANDEYQAEFDNTDFDSMDNSDFSNESYDTDFSGDII